MRVKQWIAAVLVCTILFPGLSIARGGSRGGTHSHSSGHHSNQGGHYVGGHGSSHKGGHYVNSRTGNHYVHHEPGSGDAKKHQPNVTRR
jgi:hypothetical protein